jgi:uncharacterized protein YbaP (TraB family)
MRKVCFGLVAMLILAMTQGVYAANSLWKVSKGDKYLYIMGSVHLLKPSDYPLAEEVEKAFEDSEVLVMEVANPDDPEQAMKMMQKGTLPQGKTLKSVLSNEAYAQAGTMAKKIGMPLAPFESYKPWLFSMMTSITLMMKSGYSPDMGVDLHFYRKAKRRQMNIKGLETLDQQFAMLDDVGSRYPNEFIMQTASELDSILPMVDQMVEAWKKGEPDAIDELMNQSMHDYPELEKTLLTDRNVRWIPQIMELLSSPSVHFVVFGAGHLPGEKGVLALLEKQNVQIEQL